MMHNIAAFGLSANFPNAMGRVPYLCDALRRMVELSVPCLLPRSLEAKMPFGLQFIDPTR
jgi:hypothetical protein